MKTLKLVSFLMLVIIGCNNKPRSYVKYEEKKIVIPDTIRTLGGFTIGMAETELNTLIHTSKKYYRDSRLLMPMVCTKIDNRNYSMSINLYRGKLKDITYMGLYGFDKVDDAKLKAHYKNICDQLKALNKNITMKNVYYDKFQAEWPYSCGKDLIAIARLKVGSEWFDNEFTIYLSQNEDDYKYNLLIGFSGAREGEYEPSLAKSLYYDDL